MFLGHHEFFDHFHSKGEWWLPETPQLTVNGVLTHTDVETTLELNGTLRDEDFRSRGTLKIPDPTPVIFGKLDSGDFCTLYKNSKLSEKMPLFGKPTYSKWGSRILFVGEHIADPSNFGFSSWSLSYTGLEEWLDDRPFMPFEDKREGEKILELTARYVAPPTFSVTIPSLDATLESKHEVRVRGDWVRSQRVEHTAFLVVRPANPQGFEWFMDTFRNLQNFLLLCVGEPLCTKSIIAQAETRPDPGSDPVATDIYVFYHSENRKRRTPVSTAEMLMPLSSLQANFPEMISGWFDKAETLRNVYSLFFGTFYNDNLYAESVFLCLIQALETYSRSRKNSLYVTPENYDEIAAALNAAIPADADGDLKQSLKKRIEYGNEHSLRRRLKEILKSLEGKDCQTYLR